MRSDDSSTDSSTRARVLESVLEYRNAVLGLVLEYRREVLVLGLDLRFPVLGLDSYSAKTVLVPSLRFTDVRLGCMFATK